MAEARRDDEGATTSLDLILTCQLTILPAQPQPGLANDFPFILSILQKIGFFFSLVLHQVDDGIIMQRNTFAQSPPLHHPVPQHVSTVPQLRSPPPPPGSAQSQQQAYSGNPYQQQGGASGNVFGAYGQFMNDPTAQVAAQFGQTAFKHGQEYVEQNVRFLASLEGVLASLLTSDAANNEYSLDDMSTSQH